MRKAPRDGAERVKVDEVVVRVFGEAAVVTGRTVASSGGAKPTTVTLRFTDVFVRRAGHWQVVASHATQLTS
jgi:ketosteroid isomerase-like protein